MARAFLPSAQSPSHTGSGTVPILMLRRQLGLIRRWMSLVVHQEDGRQGYQVGSARQIRQFLVLLGKSAGSVLRSDFTYLRRYIGLHRFLFSHIPSPKPVYDTI